jgi:hypothetical protein
MSQILPVLLTPRCFATCNVLKYRSGFTNFGPIPKLDHHDGCFSVPRMCLQLDSKDPTSQHQNIINDQIKKEAEQNTLIPVQLIHVLPTESSSPLPATYSQAYPNHRTTPKHLQFPLLESHLAPDLPVRMPVRMHHHL